MPSFSSCGVDTMRCRTVPRAVHLQGQGQRQWTAGHVLASDPMERKPPTRHDWTNQFSQSRRDTARGLGELICADQLRPPAAWLPETRRHTGGRVSKEDLETSGGGPGVHTECRVASSSTPGAAFEPVLVLRCSQQPKVYTSPMFSPRGWGSAVGSTPDQGAQLSPKQKWHSNTCGHKMSLGHSVQCEKPDVEVLRPVCEMPRTGTPREEADRPGGWGWGRVTAAGEGVFGVMSCGSGQW